MCLSDLLTFIILFYRIHVISYHIILMFQAFYHLDRFPEFPVPNDALKSTKASLIHNDFIGV